ncbi:MAG: sulfatase-like hydrolase/transferase [Eubacteriaceae bacterium]|nr:sulfatase-like hydrolase/transferase [Eubacteriaceae bacterium]
MNQIRDFFNRYLKNSFVFCLVWAFGLNLIIETLARKGLGGIEFLLNSPVIFLYNTLIIFATLVIATVFKRRVFFVTVITALWMSIGIANGVILMQRITPFTMKDLSNLTDGISLLSNYFSSKQIIMIFVGVALLVLALVLLWIKAPKKKGEVNHKRNILAMLLVIALTFGATFGLIKVNVLSTFFGNLGYAYSDYGVPYCFINTWLNTGIKRPIGYSEESVKAIFNAEDYNEDGTMTPVQEDVDDQYPNILFLQLESFVDPELFNHITLSKDPVPYFRSLLENYSSGKLRVPACGAGTANTEFEVMTGISVKFFGPGEYPFKSVLKETPAESAAADLKAMGFSTHAIHNHRALFYNRNKVFNNIGFDTFTSLEYMSDVPKTPKNWAKDNILVKQITEAMKSTEGKDYIYTISVQGHGKYPEEQLISNPAIKVTYAPSEEIKNKYEYYVNQIYEMDQFLKSLTKALEKCGEDVVLVIYGDHIPALDVSEDSYDEKNLYTTQYVIWDNFGMEKKDKNLTTYQLTAEVFDRLDIHKGTVFKYHQLNDPESNNYRKNLKTLGYDMLYGKHYIYGGENPFHESGMQMGVKKIEVKEVLQIGDKYYIKGKNFTEYSKITLNGKVLKTIYLNPTLLGLLEEVDPEDVKDMKVSQIDKSNKDIISTTE